MPDEPRRRKQLRLREYDYTSYGAYFITIVTRDRAHLFGEISNDVLHNSQAGDRVLEAWIALSDHFATIQLDAFVLMPNHVHGILWLLDEPVGPRGQGEASGALRPHQARFRSRLYDPSSGTLLGYSNRSLRLRSIVRWARTGDVWQRNYFEKIIRSQAQLDALRRYIDENPLRWALDEENVDDRTTARR